MLYHSSLECLLPLENLLPFLLEQHLTSFGGFGKPRACLFTWTFPHSFFGDVASQPMCLNRCQVWSCLGINSFFQVLRARPWRYW